MSAAKKFTTGTAVEIQSTAQFEEYKSGCGDKLLVVDFHADWCGPCKAIGPDFLKFSQEMPDVYFIKVNVDELEEVAASCKVNCMPTFHFYKNGVLLKTFSGANASALKKTIEDLK